MGVRIGLGLADFPFSGPRAFFRWVEACEAGGVDSVWQSDRLVSARPQLETMSVMAALAGATDRLKFGMNVAVVSFRDPLVLAKQCATIDYLSDGRLLPAFGVGPAVAPEWTATGREYRGAGARADEALDLMVRLWSGERVTSHGAHWRYEGACIAPVPRQRPLPLWIGGSSAAAVRRTARVGTGWLGGIQTPAQVAPVVAAIRAASAAAGRAVPEDHYGATFPFRFGRWDEPVVQGAAAALARFAPEVDPRAYAAIGDARDVLARIDEYVAAGVTKFVLRPLGAGDEELLGQTQRLCAEVIPAAQAAPHRA